MSPNCSPLYVACFENDHVPTEFNYGNKNIFMIDGHVDSLWQFYEYVNHCHEHLKFTISYVGT